MGVSGILILSCTCIHGYTLQNLKSEYNTLAPVFGTCCENGQSLAEHCEDSESRGDLESKLGQLQSDWEKLGQRFGEVLQKLSDALVQVGGVTVSIVTSVV